MFEPIFCMVRKASLNYSWDKLHSVSQLSRVGCNLHLPENKSYSDVLEHILCICLELALPLNKYHSIRLCGMLFTLSYLLPIRLISNKIAILPSKKKFLLCSNEYIFPDYFSQLSSWTVEEKIGRIYFRLLGINCFCQYYSSAMLHTALKCDPLKLCQTVPGRMMLSTPQFLLPHRTPSDVERLCYASQYTL